MGRGEKLAAWIASGEAVRFLAVLVVATPCPLLIAIPVAIIGASFVRHLRPRHLFNRVIVLTPVSSHIETSLVGNVRELSPAARRLIANAANIRRVKMPKQFAISDMLISSIS